MTVRIRVTVDIDQLMPGAGGALLGQNQSNDPGYGGTLAAGAAGASQTLELMVAETVPGGDTPTLANFLTALTAAANDLAGTPASGGLAIMSQPGAWGGNPGTPLAIVQAWPTGGP